jgi:hypothetical protein
VAGGRIYTVEEFAMTVNQRSVGAVAR